MPYVSKLLSLSLIEIGHPIPLILFIFIMTSYGRKMQKNTFMRYVIMSFFQFMKCYMAILLLLEFHTRLLKTYIIL